MRRYFILFTVACFLSFTAFSQAKSELTDKTIIPVAGVLAVGCVDNPFSFTAGIQKVLKPHWRLSYDIHYFNTNYEDYYLNLYSKGHFISFTPSVKLLYNTGKKTGKGFTAGLGLGYMIARDRGTEQDYIYDPATGTHIIQKDLRTGNWDFHTISPSVTLGYGFRISHFPVTLNSLYYIGKDTRGWAVLAGGVGVSFGFKRL